MKKNILLISFVLRDKNGVNNEWLQCRLSLIEAYIYVANRVHYKKYFEN